MGSASGGWGFGAAIPAGIICAIVGGFTGHAVGRRVEKTSRRFERELMPPAEPKM